MRSIVKLNLLAIAIFMNGCSLHKVEGPSFNDVMKPTPNDNSSLVYIYRVNDHDRFSNGAINVKINDRRTIELYANAFAYSVLEPGEYTFSVEWAFWDKPLLEDGKFDSKNMSYTFEPGKTYYLNYSIKLDDEPIRYLEKNGLLGKLLSHSHVISAGLEIETDSVGLSKLETCKYLSSNDSSYQKTNEYTY